MHKVVQIIRFTNHLNIVKSNKIKNFRSNSPDLSQFFFTLIYVKNPQLLLNANCSHLDTNYGTKCHKLSIHLHIFRKSYYRMLDYNRDNQGP